MIVAGISLIIYTIYLDRVIVNRFEQRRWNLPSRIYSDSFPLYSGKPLLAKELTSRLLHLGYRPKQSPPKHHGEYQQSGHNFKIYLHSFKYPHEEFQGQSISFSLTNGKVTNLSDQNGKALDLSKLEPEVIASIFDEKMEDRTFVALKEIPRILTQSVILIEDERFYSHAGIDPIGIARAFFTNIVRGRLAQGGSTLTQQMVKNFFLTHERTLRRKLNEILMATIIDFRYSKDEILEVYLNEIYFGQRGAVSITGVQEASKAYFSKSVSQLTIDEAALLAAMIQAPGRYSPFRNPKNATKRRNLIIERLYKNKDIDKKQYQQSLSRPVPTKNQEKQKSRPGYFIDFVKKQLKANFPEDKLNSEGLSIFTTLDMHQQRAAEKALQTRLKNLEDKRKYLKKKTAAGKFLEGALISIHPKTGFIRAYVGGRDYGKNQFDVLSQAKRQPGSTFKPFVYLTALDNDVVEPPFTLASRLDDQPLTLKTGAGPWRPKNYDGKNHGIVSFRKALEMSYNIATVWLSQQIGLENIVETTELAGIQGNIKPYPSIVLGAIEVTPLNFAEAYTVFANNGIRSQALAIRRVVTSSGEILERKSLKMKRSFPHNTIFLMNQALQGVLDRGTARSTRARGFTKRAAGKTGTTSDYRDSWFVGYTPDLLAMVWVGYKDNDKTQLSGSSGALPIWTDFMNVATASLPNSSFQPSNDIVIVPIDQETGLLYHRKCSQEISEYFIDGTEPMSYCHKQ